MTDRWKNVPMQRRFDRKYIPEPNSGCWLWLGTLHEGDYGEFRIRGGRRVRAHVWSFKNAGSKVPRGKFVLHTCDIRCCVNPDHLYAGTKKQNTADAIARNRFPTGVHHHFTTLTEQDVRAIRIDSRVQTAIAKEYGVGQMTVCNIKRRKTWRHVQ